MNFKVGDKVTLKSEWHNHSRFGEVMTVCELGDWHHATGGWFEAAENTEGPWNSTCFETVGGPW